MLNLNSDDINLYLHKNIDNIYSKVISAAKKNKGKEENFRTEFAIIINDIFRDLDIDSEINPEQEYSVARGRIDSLYGNIIIEYKAPGRIVKKNPSANKQFIDQVKRQVQGLADKNKIPKEKILGVVFDGHYLIYVRYRNEIWSVSEVLKVDKESLELFLKRLLSLSIEKKALTIENLLNDFSSNSERTKKLVEVFYSKCVNNTSYNKPKLLFEQWKHLFREVCGYDFDTLDLKIQDLKKHYNIGEEKIKVDCLIFSIHTYFALIIKFLTIEVLTYLSNKKNEGLNALTIDNQSILNEQLEDMESGGLYKKLGVTNFLEGDFFGWYLSLWDDEIYYELRDLIDEFRKYDYSSINLEPESAKDLLKDVYHNLFPKELRHNLGEYYTPDWLAEFLINEMNMDYSLNKSILDPTCGSGTFIVLLIRNYIAYNKDKMDDTEMLDNILSNIKGYDLNPLAVISAKSSPN
ncbi:MAG: N-6 DNA methylase [Tepidanaerobacteraceae bacterium]